MRGATVLLLLACVGCKKKEPPLEEVPNVAVQGEPVVIGPRGEPINLKEALTGSPAVRLKYADLWAEAGQPVDPEEASRKAVAAGRFARSPLPYQAAAVLGAPAGGGAHAALAPAALDRAYPPAAEYLKANWTKGVVRSTARDFATYDGTATTGTGAARQVVLKVAAADPGNQFEAFVARVHKELRDGGVAVPPHTRGGLRKYAEAVELKYTHEHRAGALTLMLADKYDEGDAELVAAIAGSGAADLLKIMMNEPGPYLLVLVRERFE